jgi:hypothetical protein
MCEVKKESPLDYSPSTNELNEIMLNAYFSENSVLYI